MPCRYTGVTHTSSFAVRTHTCGELRKSDAGRKVKLCGWVQYQRMNKFVLLRDAYGVTQLVVPDEVCSLWRLIVLSNVEVTFTFLTLAHSRRWIWPIRSRVFPWNQSYRQMGKLQKGFQARTILYATPALMILWIFNDLQRCFSLFFSGRTKSLERLKSFWRISKFFPPQPPTCHFWSRTPPRLLSFKSTHNHRQYSWFMLLNLVVFPYIGEGTFENGT